MEKRKQVLPDGRIRYRLIGDGGDSPSGVIWETIVSGGKSKGAREAQKLAVKVMNAAARARDERNARLDADAKAVADGNTA